MSKFIVHLRAQWMGALALFLVIAGGTAYAADTVFSTDIVDGEVKSVDIGNNQVQSADVRNGALNDEDVGQGTFVNFVGVIGSVPAQSCVEKTVSGVTAQGDHLLLTPDFDTQHPNLAYSAESDSSDGSMTIQVCNPTTGAINDGNTNFNLLVIDAQ